MDRRRDEVIPFMEEEWKREAKHSFFGCERSGKYNSLFRKRCLSLTERQLTR